MLREAPLEINPKCALDRKHVPHGGKAACFGSPLRKLSTLDVKYKRTHSDSSLRNKVTQSQMLKQTAAGIQGNDRSHAHFIIASESFFFFFLDGAKERDSHIRFEVGSLGGSASCPPIGQGLLRIFLRHARRTAQMHPRSDRFSSSRCCNQLQTDSASFAAAA